MSVWLVTAPSHPNEPYAIWTDDPEFAQTFPLPVGKEMYTLTNALSYIGYRMNIGDTIVTKEPEKRVYPR